MSESIPPLPTPDGLVAELPTIPDLPDPNRSSCPGDLRRGQLPPTWIRRFHFSPQTPSIPTLPGELKPPSLLTLPPSKLVIPPTPRPGLQLSPPKNNLIASPPQLPQQQPAPGRGQGSPLPRPSLSRAPATQTPILFTERPDLGGAIALTAVGIA